MTSRKITAKIGSILWYGTVTVIIVAAVVLVLARLALPRVESYRVQIEQKISHYIGQPVKLASLDARLLGLSPTLIFENVDLLDKAGEKSIAHFTQAHIGLDIISSLRRQQFVFGKLTVLGINLHLERRADGSFLLQGVALPVQDKTEKRLQDSQLLNWLLLQGRLAIQESQMEWVDQVLGGQRYIFENVNLELKNSGIRHQLNGSVQLPTYLGESLQIAIDINGNILQSSDWQGDVYLKAEGIKSIDWLPATLLHDVKMKQGRVDTRFWTHWQEGAFHSGEGDFSIQNLHMVNQFDEPVIFNRASGQVALKHENNYWHVDVNSLRLQRGEQRWQPTRLQLEKSDKDNSGRLLSSYLKLDDLATLAMIVPGLEKEQLTDLRKITPQGELQNVGIEYRPDKKFRMRADFHNAGLSSWRKLPGLSGLDGSVYFDGSNIRVNLDSQDAVLELPDIFRSSVEFSSLKGMLDAQKIGSDWLFVSENLYASTPDVDAQLGLTVVFPESGVPYMDLRGEFKDGRVEAIPNYYPTSMMKDSLVEWLDRAFTQGRIVSGGAIFHGPVKSFPFVDNRGRFEVVFNTDDLQLDYMEGWPKLTDVESEVVFERDGMDIAVNSAWIFDSHISNSHISIPRFKTARLDIQAEAQGPLTDVLKFIIEASLVEPLTETLSSFKAGGESRVEVVLDIPLAEEEKKQRETHVTGRIHLDNNRLQVIEGVELTQLTGQVDFDDTDFESPQLDAHIFEEPASLKISTQGTGESAVTRVTAEGYAQGTILDKNLDLPFLSHLHGRTSWLGVLTIPQIEEGETTLAAESDLIGMAVDLPDPLGKLESTAGHLQTYYYLSGPKSGQLLLDYNKRVSANMQLDEDEYTLQRMGVHFGTERARLPGTDIIYLTGALGEVNLTEWGEIFDEEEGGDEPFPPLQVALDRIHVIADEGEESEGFTDLSGIPPVSAWIGQFSYDGMHFEQFAFQTSYKAGRMDINDIFLVGPSIKATGVGHWYIKNNRTEIQWQLESDHFGRMMKTLDTVSVITKGKATSHGLFHWPGSPADFHWGRLGGKVHAEIKNGNLDEVEPGSARLLGLLSLQALPKRLFLDFSDMFAKGVDFSRLSGDFLIEKGDASTNNVKIKTLVGEIYITGRTHLDKEEIDQIITVNPDVTGTLPVAGYLAGGPQLGTIMLFVKQIFGKKIAKANRVQYQVTGSWDEPVITELKEGD